MYDKEMSQDFFPLGVIYIYLYISFLPYISKLFILIAIKLFKIHGFNFGKTWNMAISWDESLGIALYSGGFTVG